MLHGYRNALVNGRTDQGTANSNAARVFIVIAGVN